MKRSDMTPIKGLEDVFKIWAIHNKVTVDYVSGAHIAKQEELLRSRMLVAVNMLFCAFFVSLVVYHISHLFSDHRLLVLYSLWGIGIIGCASFVWFVITLFAFHFRKRPSLEVLRFEHDWDRFRALFKIKDLATFPYTSVLWVYVECALEEARQIHGSNGTSNQNQFVEMHEVALRFDMCQANRFSYEPLSCRTKTTVVA